MNTNYDMWGYRAPKGFRDKHRIKPKTGSKLSKKEINKRKKIRRG